MRLINRTPVSDELKAKYALEGACQIVADLDAIEALGVIPVLGDYLEEADVARHNTARVASDLVQLASSWRGRAQEPLRCRSLNSRSSHFSFHTPLALARMSGDEVVDGAKINVKIKTRMNAGTGTKTLPIALLVAFVLLGAAAAQKEKDTEPTAILNFLIVKEDNGKPVRNAAVIMHPVNPHGKQSRGGLELKTDADGKTSFDGIPYGMLRVQVLASGFQTFGEDYDVDRGQDELHHQAETAPRPVLHLSGPP